VHREISIMIALPSGSLMHGFDPAPFVPRARGPPSSTDEQPLLGECTPRTAAARRVQRLRSRAIGVLRCISMSARLAALLSGLGLFVIVASSAALYAGVQELRLLATGARRQLTAESLASGTAGWLAVAGCVRHDLALGVTAGGRVYPLGAAPPESEESDRVFTPLAARDDCDDERAPRRLYALIEDDDALTNTIGHAYRARVAPPPVLAIVDGVAGFGAGHARLADRARAELARSGQAAGGLPLLAKGQRPGVRWVAITTAAAGVHGFVLLGLGVAWVLRRARRRRERAARSEVEEAFFRSETLD
jgi:hypothetical protein